MFLSRFNTLFVSRIEFVFGALLILGALTPIACVMLGGVMITAITTTAIHNIKASCPLNLLTEVLYLPEVVYLVILIWLFFSGPGWIGVDHLILSQIRDHDRKVTQRASPPVAAHVQGFRHLANATRVGYQMAARKVFQVSARVLHGMPQHQW
jgi:hypothetical protein